MKKVQLIQDKMNEWYPRLNFKKKNGKQVHDPSCDYDPYEKVIEQMNANHEKKEKRKAKQNKERAEKQKQKKKDKKKKMQEKRQKAAKVKEESEKKTEL